MGKSIPTTHSSHKTYILASARCVPSLYPKNVGISPAYNLRHLPADCFRYQRIITSGKCGPCHGLPANILWNTFLLVKDFIRTQKFKSHSPHFKITPAYGVNKFTCVFIKTIIHSSRINSQDFHKAGFLRLPGRNLGKYPILNLPCQDIMSALLTIWSLA